jgi:hypothetical protein
MPTAQRFLLPAAGVAVGVASTLWLAHVRAAGIPTTEPLYYSGTLEDNGAPVTGSRDVTLRLWDDATDPATLHKKCETSSPTTTFDNGRFRIPLDATCQGAIAANPNLWVEVVVGATSLGRKKVGAVPYAVEAQSAVTATTATTASGALADQIVPSGAILYFNGACPSGWTEFTNARGRYVVGLTSGGTLNTGVGTALSNQENRATGQHTHAITDPGHGHGLTQSPHGHTINDPGHTHGIPVGTGAGGFPWYYTPNGGSADALSTNSQPTGISINTSSISISVNSGGTSISVNNTAAPNNVAGTNAPYIQLRVCQKI